MKVITEEVLKKIVPRDESERRLLKFLLVTECQELDTLTGWNEPDLILAAEKYAENYDGDERQDIKTDVLNAYYQGAYWNKKQPSDTLTVDRLRPMSDAPRDGRYIRVYWETGFPGEWCDDFVFWNERFEGWERDWVDPEDEVLQDRNFDGFIDVPRYEPEKS